MAILNRLIEDIFGGNDIKKEALFHCADEMVREAVGRILEFGIDRQNVQFLLPRARNKNNTITYGYEYVLVLVQRWTR